jgi:polysaccharide biosynthesis transport protein
VGTIAASFPVPFGKKARTEAVPTEQVLRYQPFREAMDLLYHNLQFLEMQGGLKSIVVTSAMAGEGKSTIALGLAISAARLHQRVLLIDGDLRRSRLHQLLNLSNEQGLSNLLMDQMPLSALLGEDGASRSNIAVLPAGPPPKDPAKLLSSPRMREMMRQLEDAYDLVIVDAPPVMGMVDALLEASCCRGTILVGRLGYMTKAELAQVMSTLKKVNLVGVVSNGDRSPLAAGSAY